MADVAGKQRLTYRGVDLDGGALIPLEVAEELVESISAWVPMPYEVIADSEYHVWLWERMRMVHAGLRRPTLAERIRGRMTIEGESGYDHDFDLGWRLWLAGQRQEWSERLNVKAHVARWLHDRYFAGYCPECDR